MVCIQKKISVTIITMCVTATAASCASSSLEKRTDAAGRIEQITVLKKGSATGRLAFEYDKSGRTASVKKYIPSRETPVASRIFTYDQLGRLKFQSHHAVQTDKGKTIDDIWIESFYYNSSGQLLKTETSFKSAYSIALHTTPLLVAKYFYSNNRLSAIRLDAGLFRANAAISYDNGSPSEIDYKKSNFNRQGGNYVMTQHTLFSMERGHPVRARDVIGAKDITQAEDVKSAYAAAKMGELLKKVEYSADVSVLLSDLTNQWAR